MPDQPVSAGNTRSLPDSPQTGAPVTLQADPLRKPIFFSRGQASFRRVEGQEGHQREFRGGQTPGEAPVSQSRMFCMTSGSEMTPEQCADGERDARTAIAAAFVRNDMEAVQLISRNSDGLVEWMQLPVFRDLLVIHPVAADLADLADPRPCRSAATLPRSS